VKRAQRSQRNSSSRIRNASHARTFECSRVRLDSCHFVEAHSATRFSSLRAEPRPASAMRAPDFFRRALELEPNTAWRVA
jgi:hypothetical protein